NLQLNRGEPREIALLTPPLDFGMPANDPQTGTWCVNQDQIEARVQRQRLRFSQQWMRARDAQTTDVGAPPLHPLTIVVDRNDAAAIAHPDRHLRGLATRRSSNLQDPIARLRRNQTAQY